jgi:septal ring factor EnvC (AmiA/AmiB activator)
MSRPGWDDQFRESPSERAERWRRIKQTRVANGFCAICARSICACNDSLEALGDSIADVCAKLGAIADHLEALDSESGEARTFRMCAAYLKQQEDDIAAIRAALEKAHETAEISECRIAEVYGRIVKARDHIREELEPGVNGNVRTAFNLLQEAKYGLGGRTNVAGSIAQIKRELPA